MATPAFDSPAPDAPAVWTLGHSTHSGEAFLALLQSHGIEALVDVRRFPGSRRHPQFGAEALGALLEGHGIAYRWVRELGGRRRPVEADPEGSAWRHPSFRAYAQHLQTEEFARGLDTLLHVASACRTAIMCSELLWWRCHRALISDALLFSGWQVHHILGATQESEHRYSSPARVAAGVLSYRVVAQDAPAHCC
jgi:uncharacterized protein (DUF488 family)